MQVNRCVSSAGCTGRSQSELGVTASLAVVVIMWTSCQLLRPCLNVAIVTFNWKLSIAAGSADAVLQSWAAFV